MDGIPMKLGIVIPVYGNENSLLILYDRINRIFQDQQIELTIFFVNDRSPDNSQEILKGLAEKDPRVRVLLLSKNHGSFVAVVAGLNYTLDNDAVVILSADLQDPPEVIPEMIEKWFEGFPVVLCVRQERSDSFITKFFANAFHLLYRKFVMPDMPKGGFDFCLIDRRVVEVVIASSEKSTSLIGLIIWAGFDRAYIPYKRAERIHGKSMWSFRKKFRYAINSIISFSSLPLKLFGLLGVVLAFICFLGITVTTYNYLSGRILVYGWTSLILAVLTMAAFQFLAIGILGEYFWNNLEQTRKRPLFIVDNIIGGQKPVAKNSDFTTDIIPFFDLNYVSHPVVQSLKETAVRVIERSNLILGPEVQRFERELAGYVGMKYAVGVANGTDALTISLWASGIKTGDKVITSSISAPATAVAIIRAGAIPVFVDVDEKFLTIDRLRIFWLGFRASPSDKPVLSYSKYNPIIYCN